MESHGILKASKSINPGLTVHQQDTCRFCLGEYIRSCRCKAANLSFYMFFREQFSTHHFAAFHVHTLHKLIFVYKKCLILSNNSSRRRLKLLILKRC